MRCRLAIIPVIPSPVALLAAAALAALAAPDARGQAWVQEYQKNIKSESADKRRAAIEVIDTEVERAALGLLIDVLANSNKAEVDWYQREAAIAKLSELEDEKVSLKKIDELMKKLVKKSKEPALLASLIEAASLNGDARFHAHLADALEPKAGHPADVHRAAIRAMGRTGKLDFVPAIIAHWEAEALDHRTALACREALKEITEVDQGRGVAAWKAFWAAEGKGYVKPSARPSGSGGGDSGGTTTAPKEPESEKKRITTVTREMPLNFTTTGREGASSTIPLLVIHDDTWSPEYFDPYLSCLDDIYTIYYVELPKISALVELYKDKPDKIKRNIGGFPFYPYEALCDAFDEARKEQGHQKFAILAHGFSTIVAQRYLTKYSENVTHAIFVGALPGDDAYGNALEKLQGKAAGWKEKEIVRAVDYHYITDEKTFKRFYDPKDDTELQALERKWFTIMFANPQDPEIGRIWERARTAANTSLKAAEREQSQSPPFDISREKKPATPMLVISGKKSVWFGEADGERVAKNYPRGKHVVLAEAANMPWFDDPKGFQKAVRDFVGSLSK